jgi:hypothetical protein
MKCPKCGAETCIGSRMLKGPTVQREYRVICTDGCDLGDDYYTVEQLFAELDRVRAVIPTIRERAQKWQGEDIIAYQDLINSAAALEKALEGK